MTAVDNPWLPNRLVPFGGASSELTLLGALGVRSLSSTCTAEPEGFDHRHRLEDRWALVATLQGTARLHQAQRHEPITVSPGWAYLVPPGLSFREQQSGTTPWLTVATLIGAPATCAWIPISPDRIHVTQIGIEALQRHWRLADTLDRKPDYLDLDVLQQATRLVLDFLNAESAAQARPPAFVERALAHMRLHVTRLLTVSELAAHCGMSDSAFAHRFKDETGMSPMRAFDRERIRRARELLMAGQSVTETADRLGFATPYHFSRVFKRIEGVPPRHFRQLSDRRW